MKGNRLKFFFLLLVVLAPSFAWGQDKDRSTLFSFLSITYDARSVGRAGISSVAHDNGEYSSGNPALSSDVSTAQFALGFQPYGMETFTGFLSGAIRLESGVVLAPSMHYITYGSFDALDSLGAPLDATLSPFSLDIAISASYRWFDLFSVGGSFAVAYEKLTPKIGNLIDENYGVAFLFDFGMLYDLRQVRFASGVRNLGFWSGFDSEEADQWSLPTALYFSLLWSIPSKVPVGIYFEADKQVASYLVFRGAFELSFKRDVFSLRLGSSVSLDEIAELFDSGNTEVYDYSKRDWQIFSTGFSFNIPIQSKTLFFDMGVGFRADGIAPQFAFSGGMDF